MKKLIFLVLGLLSIYNISSAQDSAKWNIQKSTHFVIYYKNAQADFISELINKSEDYYNNIAKDLGFNRYNFWLWDNRAKIYIYDDAWEFKYATGQPDWSGGSANIAGKIIKTFPYADGLFETILPHEIGHLIFSEFVGGNNPAIPLWLNEGVACYQEKSRYRVSNTELKQAIEFGGLNNYGQLSGFTLNPSMQDDLVHLLYAKAFSIVDFLIKDFGRDKFVDFCRDLRDRKNLQSALTSNYHFKDVQELDSTWQKYLSLNTK